MNHLSNTREHELNLALEAMHFGFRAMVHKPNQQLATLGFSRIHHRILYFIRKNQHGNVKQLIETLGVSKQYLNKPLKHLIQTGYVIEQANPLDKRQKQLSLSDKGKQLEQQLSGMQRQLFEDIFQQSGKEAEQSWYAVMDLLIKTRQT